jgi:hypothetical protein
MISQLHVENFRSIEKATIDLGRITPLTKTSNLCSQPTASLVSNVVNKNLQPNDLKIYYLTKEGRSTQIEHQAVNAV